MGALDIDSVPPATTISEVPAAMASAACITAASPEPHTRFTVSAGTVAGSPAPSAACRATFMPAPACSTHPMTTSSMRSTPTCARAIASRITIDAQLRGRQILQRAAERADRRAAGGQDDCGHSTTLS